MTALVLIACMGRAVASGPALGMAGESESVQIDGLPAFVLGVSMFDALGSTPVRDHDLDALKQWGVKLVRVWAHWREPIYGGDGNLTAQGQARLTTLVRRLQERGLILELVLLRPGQLPGQPFAVFTSPEARLQAVRSITSALRDSRNVVFDLYNEHDHHDGPITHAEARVGRDAVKAIDPQRLVTISSTEHHLMTRDGRIGESEAANLRAEAGQDADSVGVDFLAVHLPRTADWAEATGPRIRALRAALDRIGRPLPIYLSEERRAEGATAIAAAAYRTAVQGARQAGAAGWVFHTSAGYDLTARAFV